MNAQILCVGTELLLGDVVNTNAAEIARLLAGLGIGVYRQTVVGDNPDRLAAALTEALGESDAVILTGGLGPTYDDLTKQTVARCFGRELVLHPEEEARLRTFFERSGAKMTENNLQQAMLPEGCIVLENHNGTAPGCILEKDGKAAILLPGPPREMRPMLQGQVADYLRRRSGQVLKSRTLNFFGIGESALENAVREEISQMTDPTVAPYAKPGEVQLRITAAGKDAHECEEKIAPVEAALREKFAKYCYGAEWQSLQEAVVKTFRKEKRTLAAAESCTGGLVASRIVEIPGASDMFGCGIVSYWEETKKAVLGVSQKTLEEKTAVSCECALEMAHGVQRLSGADVAVATTGYAGPGGEKVGLVYVAAVGMGRELVRELHLARGREDDRETIRLMASSWALRLALMLLDGNTLLIDGRKQS